MQLENKNKIGVNVHVSRSKRCANFQFKRSKIKFIGRQRTQEMMHRLSRVNAAWPNLLWTVIRSCQREWSLKSVCAQPGGRPHVWRYHCSLSSDCVQNVSQHIYRGHCFPHSLTVTKSVIVYYSPLLSVFRITLFFQMQLFESIL